MNDAYDNAATDREMQERFGEPRVGEITGRRFWTFANIIDQLTEDEATALLTWLATNKPDAFRTALRTSASWAPRIHQLYRAAGRPHQ